MSTTSRSLPSSATASLPRYGLTADGERSLRDEPERRLKLAPSTVSVASSASSPGVEAVFAPVASTIVHGVVEASVTFVLSRRRAP